MELSLCRDAIEPLNSALEECLALLRKCATIGVMEKMFDKGETKGALEAASHRLNAAFQLFSTWLNVAKCQPGPKAEPAAVIEQRVEKGREAQGYEGAPVAVPAASSGQPVERRPSSSQIYPDLL